jgi:hypothetical protein
LHFWIIACASLWGTHAALGQIDPKPRSLLQLGYDQALVGQGPQALYLYYYYNDPDLFGTNTALRAAIAPAYVDGELGFKHLLSPYTDVGIGIYGGAFSDNYYEVNQGDYLENQSFYGFGGGSALSLYQLVNPGMRIPVNVVVRGGARYTTYRKTNKTADDFQLPPGHTTGFFRTGVRLAGKEPILYPDLGMEVSAWFERQWRGHPGPYGFNDDRSLAAACNLYWAHAAINYTWTNIDHHISLAVTAGGSVDADRFSAWRLGGVLPLVAEFPLILPGYYYEELSAERFVHLYAAYAFPLDSEHRWRFRLEAASARVDFLTGFEQPNLWQTGVGCGLSFRPRSRIYKIVVRYGYGINAIRGDTEGGHSIGLLFQFNFDRLKEIRRER